MAASRFGRFALIFPAVTASGWCGGLNSPVVADPEGRLFVPRFYCDVPSLAVSEDDGLTWTSYAIAAPQPLRSDLVPGVKYIDGRVLSLDADATGRLHAAFVGADGRLHYGTSNDHGRTWSDLVDVTPAGVLAVAPSLAAVGTGGDGDFAIALVGTSFAIVEEKNWAGATWDAYILRGNSADLSGAQAYRLNDADDPLGVDDCGFTRCSPCEFASCAGMYDYIDVDIDAQGRPWAAFVDVCHQECRLTGNHDRALAALGTLSGDVAVGHAARLAELPWMR